MGRIAKRLPVYSSSGPDVDWSPTEIQLQELQAILGDAHFSDEIKTTLISSCRTYLQYRQAELGAGMQSEALNIWQGTKKSPGLGETIQRMIMVGEGSYPPFNAAGRLVENAFFDALEGVPIQLTERDIEPAGLGPFQSTGDEPVKGLHLNVSRSFLMRLAHVFRIASQRAEHAITNLGDGFRPGQAFSSWIGDMRGWAIQNGYPCDSASGGETSKFSEFLFALHSMLPSELRERQMASAAAMNQRLIRHLKGGISNTSQS